MEKLRCLVLLIAVLFTTACRSTEAGENPTQQDTVNPTADLTPRTPTVFRITPSSTPPAVSTQTPSPTPTLLSVTTLLFTGVIVPARCVQAAVDDSGNPDDIYAEVSGMIQQANLAIGTFNATMSDIPPHTGCVPTYVLVGSPNNADALARAGFDVMSVATNHIKDCGLTNCGDRAFFDTLDNLRRVGIQPVGAGKNLAEAMQPVVVTVNRIRFGFVSLGQIEQGGVYASTDKAGIAVLTKENAAAAIQAARQVADVVIFMPHWGPEDVAVPNWIQRNLAHQIVDAGPDLVVGNHTHVVQGMQVIKGVPVFYGLGNFVFDQWQPDHQQGVILLVRFLGTRYVGYEFIPIHVDEDGRVHFANPEEAAEVVERIQQASQYLK